MGIITINEPILEERKLTSLLSVTKDLTKYLKKKELFIEYDTDIYADTSILNIPLTATVLPLAWVTGSDIQVNELDRTFKESMDRLQLYFKDFYPIIPFNTNIKAKILVGNKIEPEDPERRTGLLFSGGVDATYSMITNLQHKPRLIMHWGVERTGVHEDYWNMVVDTYTNFAIRYGLKLNITKTNVLEILHRRRIEHRYFKELLYGTLWVRLQHSLVLLSLAAPLSINKFDKLLIAASEWPTSIETLDPFRPHAARPESDEIIAWSSLNVKHDGYIERYRKIRAMAEILRNGNEVLRVCLNRDDTSKGMNCNQCEKCGRTIIQLVQAGIDPNNCGFRVDDSSIFNKMKAYYSSHGLDSYSVNSQKIIPEKIGSNLYGSKDFFEWLKGFTIPEKKQELFFRDVYNFLPYPLARALEKAYSIIGINIYFGNPNLPEERVIKLIAINKPKKSPRTERELQSQYTSPSVQIEH